MENLEKYFVVVDHKYMVTVVSTSNGGAEHVILDNITYAKSALAFGMEDLSTETFRNYLISCQTISYDELKKQDNQLKAKGMERINMFYDEAKLIQEQIDIKYAQISEYEKGIELLKVYISSHENELETINKERREFVNKVNLVDEYVSRETIDELLAA